MGTPGTAHRVRLLVAVAVVLAGAIAGSALDPRMGRLVVFLAAVGIAVGLAAYPGWRRSSTRAGSGEERDRAALQRDQAAGRRDRAAMHRDEAGDHRDQAADRRDHDADQRDHDAAQRDADAVQLDRVADEPPAPTGEVKAADGRDRSGLDRRAADDARRRASHDRGAGAGERTIAELDRDAALADRGASASERAHAVLDRDAALADRGASAREREFASVDALTGVYLRGAGFAELEHELERARRTQQPLVLAFVDVDHLKEVNDSRGHAAGDRTLREVAHTLRASLRPYDVILRYGGDEFVCALAGIDLPAAAKRLALVNAALAQAPEHSSVAIGLAELRPGDSAEALVARADSALLTERHRQRGLAP
jgi:diguanylate cyclase (GGDEF)-like protein